MDGRALLERLAAEPRLAALCFDLDGVLAPIVERPEDGAVPAETRRELERLAGRYALVAVITGRDGDDARPRVGVEGIAYVGSHGLELEPEAEAWAERLQAFAATVDWPLEEKRLTVAFHYRTAEDEQGARRTLEVVAERARAEGFVARFGRKVLEVLPPLEADKGTAVTHLLAERGLRRALYAGDDTTDLDGFRALEGLELAVRVAVASSEGPAALREAADLVVDGPAALLELLREL
jgi:trehalose 6-phosphate phosphatase